jgi:hypothetical protein
LGTLTDASARVSLPALIPLVRKELSRGRLPEKACSRLLMGRSKRNHLLRSATTLSQSRLVSRFAKASEPGRDYLLRSRIPQHSNGRFRARLAESLMTMKSFVGVTMAFTQLFYLLHLAIIFSSTGKKIQQPRFKHRVRLGHLGKEFAAPLT